MKTIARVHILVVFLALTLSACSENFGGTAGGGTSNNGGGGSGGGGGGGGSGGGGSSPPLVTEPSSGLKVSATGPASEVAGESVRLLAEVSADESVTRYTWTQLEGPEVSLTTADASEAGFLAPAVSAPTTLRFAVIVRDAGAASGSDTVSITILPRSAAAPGRVRAGVAQRDATILLGGSAGQYASTAQNQGSVAGDQRDPSNPARSTTKQGAYGVHTRVTVVALVVEGNNGQRVALLKSDHYLAQDVLMRRVAQLLAEGSSGVTYDQIVHSASHNHSSPYQFTQAPGLAIFQDVYDARAFERVARAMRDVIEAAVADLRPVRMSGHVFRHFALKDNIVGPALANNGTPAGYPRDFGDNEVSLLRFDDLTSDPPRPYALWMNHGEHPESLDGYHLISADFVGQLQRMVKAETGATLVFTQGDVGSAEGPYDRSDQQLLLDSGIYRAFGHHGHAQMERGARLLADDVAVAFNQMTASANRIPWTSDFPVMAKSLWIAGPLSHPTPTISNCNSAQTFEGNPGAPVVGLPDCGRAEDTGFPGLGEVFGPVFGNVPAGTPIPDHYGGPGHPAVEENQRLRLQAVRLGEALLASCACEAQVDMFINLKTRTDRAANNIYNGFDWACLLPEYADMDGHAAACEIQKQWFDPAQHPYPSQDATRVPGAAMLADANKRRHMRAQIHNNAAGWDAPEYVAFAETEESDIARIKGNFTHEELPPARGYAMSVGLGHTGDYNGYTLSYREYMSRDSYRKALMAYGPHTADYMITRLVRMAGEMKGGPIFSADSTPLSVSDEQRQAAQAQSVGQASAAQFASEVPSAPADRPVAAVTQPADVQHFSAATFDWNGGSNSVDNPEVWVERFTPGLGAGDWQRVADQHGAIQVRAFFPTSDTQINQARAGQFDWRWRAYFEAFAGFPANIGNTEFGHYRFVVVGTRKVDVGVQGYRLISNSFRVLPWNGIPVEDLRAESNGDVSFVVPAYRYPDTVADSDFFHLRNDGRESAARPTPCKTCSFRPWARSGSVVTARVTVQRASGTVESVPATFLSPLGRFVAPARLQAGDRASLASGAVVDANGEINTASASVTP